MKLSEYDKVAAESWHWLARRFAYIELDEWIVMPNHLHGIIVIHDDQVSSGDPPAQSQAVGAVGRVRESPLRDENH